MNPLRCHGSVHIQVPQTVLNLIFSYNKRDFVPLVYALSFMDFGDGKERLPGKTEAKNFLGTSVFSMPVVTKSPVFLLGGTFYLVLFF